MADYLVYFDRNNGPVLWNSAFLSLRDLEQANETDRFLGPADRILVHEDHHESNVDSPQPDDYWPIFLRTGTVMPVQVLPVKEDFTPSTKRPQLTFDHVLTLRTDVVWCGMDFDVTNPQTLSIPKTMRIDEGRYEQCGFVSDDHCLIGSYYHHNRHIRIRNSVIKTRVVDSLYTFLTSSNANRRGSIVTIEDSEFHWDNERQHYDAAWWHLDCDYAHVRLLGCSFFSNATYPQRKIMARGNYSVFEADALPAGFNPSSDWVDLTGTNQLILRS